MLLFRPPNARCVASGAATCFAHFAACSCGEISYALEPHVIANDCKLTFPQPESGTGRLACNHIRVASSLACTAYLHGKLSPLPCARRQDGLGHLIDMLNVTVEPTSQSLLCLCRRRADIFRPRGSARYRDTRLEPDAGCARLSGAQMFRAVRQLSGI